jgi:ADP-ribose pyrophosphatase YjhB (NUDIX family)
MIREYPISQAEFNEIYSKVPRLNVEVIIKTKNGVVLTKRDIEPWKGYWHIPGGTVFLDETLVDAVKRVAIKELNVNVSVGQLLGYIEYPNIKEQKGLGWPVGLAFTAEIESGKLSGSSEGEEVGEFLSLPANIISEQAEFIVKHKLAGLDTVED